MIDVNAHDLISSTIITRQALGRHGSIGSLYDIRCDTLENENVFDEKNIEDTFQNLIKTGDKEWGGFGNAPKFPQTFSILLTYILKS